MMAARAGADHVTTCEENENLVAIALENVKRAHTKYPMCPVVVVAKRSTNLTVGPGMDMEQRANILVSEIVDSMLLRESIIPTLRHAMDDLVQPDAIVIPWGGKLTFMVFESKEMRDTRYLDGDVSGFDLSYLNEGAHDLNAQEFFAGS
jgi:predicted RNA methylase